MSPSASYWSNRSWQTCIRCSLCSSVTIRGTPLTQNLRYSTVATTVPNALQPIFSSVHSILVVIRRFSQMSWSRRTSFRGDSCEWPSGTWLVSHVAVATAETQHPPLHCANIHYLVSVNVQQESMNVIGCNLFLHGGIELHTFAWYPLPRQTPFCQTAPLLLYVARQQNFTEYWREGSTSTAISPPTACDMVGQHNKRGGINFGATFVIRKQTLRVPCPCIRESPILYTTASV